jgi:hypothetical protein
MWSICENWLNWLAPRGRRVVYVLLCKAVSSPSEKIVLNFASSFQYLYNYSNTVPIVQKKKIGKEKKMGKKKKIQAVSQATLASFLSKEELLAAMHALIKKLLQKQVRKEFAPIFPIDELLEEIQEFKRMGARNSRLNWVFSQAMQEIERLLRKTFPRWKEEEIDSGSSSVGKRLPELHKDALQMVFSMLEPLEIASCMMVCKGWSSAGKTPAIWKGKVLNVPTDTWGPVNPLYLAPWSGIALRHVDTVHLLSIDGLKTSRTNWGYGAGELFKQVFSGFYRQRLSNIKSLLMEVDAYLGIFDTIHKTPPEQLHLQEIVIPDGSRVGDIDAILSLLENTTSLRRAQLMSFSNIYLGTNSKWGSVWHSSEKVQEKFLASLSKNHHIRAVVVPAVNEWPGMPISRQRFKFMEQLKTTIEAHPSLDELELHIWSNISIFQATVYLLGLFTPLIGRRLKRLRIVQLPEESYWRNHWHIHGRGVENPVPILEADVQRILDIFSKLRHEEDDENPAVILSYVKGHPDVVHMRELVNQLPEELRDRVRIEIC